MQHTNRRHVELIHDEVEGCVEGCDIPSVADDVAVAVPVAALFTWVTTLAIISSVGSFVSSWGFSALTGRPPPPALDLPFSAMVFGFR
jgi:hypothetical protein